MDAGQVGILVIGAIIVIIVNVWYFSTRNRPKVHLNPDYNPDRTYTFVPKPDEPKVPQNKASQGNPSQGRSYGQGNTENYSGGNYDKERYDSNGRRIA